MLPRPFAGRRPSRPILVGISLRRLVVAPPARYRPRTSDAETAGDEDVPVARCDVLREYRRRGWTARQSSPARQAASRGRAWRNRPGSRVVESVIGNHQRRLICDESSASRTSSWLEIHDGTRRVDEQVLVLQCVQIAGDCRLISRAQMPECRRTPEDEASCRVPMSSRARAAKPVGRQRGHAVVQGAALSGVQREPEEKAGMEMLDGERLISGFELAIRGSDGVNPQRRREREG